MFDGIPRFGPCAPAANAAMAAPIWCEASTQPNTIGPRVPNASLDSATVGGTVATQSRLYTTMKMIIRGCTEA